MHMYYFISFYMQVLPKDGRRQKQTRTKRRLIVQVKQIYNVKSIDNKYDFGQLCLPVTAIDVFQKGNVSHTEIDRKTQLRSPSKCNTNCFLIIQTQQLYHTNKDTDANLKGAMNTDIRI